MFTFNTWERTNSVYCCRLSELKDGGTAFNYISPEKNGSNKYVMIRVTELIVIIRIIIIIIIIVFIIMTSLLLFW